MDPTFNPTVVTLRRVVEVFGALVGDDAKAGAVTVGRHGHAVRVDVSTPEPGRFIGRRGATADRLRAALVELFGDPELQLNIQEAAEPGPPLDPPAGVREPRRPRPPTHSTGLHLERATDEPPADIIERGAGRRARMTGTRPATDPGDSRGAA